MPMGGDVITAPVDSYVDSQVESPGAGEVDSWFAAWGLDQHPQATTLRWQCRKPSVATMYKSLNLGIGNPEPSTHESFFGRRPPD